MPDKFLNVSVKNVKCGRKMQGCKVAISIKQGNRKIVFLESPFRATLNF